MRTGRHPPARGRGVLGILLAALAAGDAAATEPLVARLETVVPIAARGAPPGACALSVTGRAAGAGLALLTVTAPCAAGAAVTLSHGAVTASFRADGAGRVETPFPAFDPLARFVARLPDGTEAAVAVRVPDAAAYERVATVWSAGGPGLSVHAFEYGARTGGTGHVWRGAPGTAAAAEAGRGGFLLALGTPGLPGGLLAEVYSFPAARAPAGAVRIALSAGQKEACGQDISATTVQTGRDLPGAPVDVTLRLPACGAGEGTLLLKNLARDLKIATR